MALPKPDDGSPVMLLVNCPYPRPSKFYGQPSSVLYAVAILAQWLQRNEIRFLNYNSWRRSDYIEHAAEHFEKVINTLSPRIVAFSCTSASLSEARRLAAIAKRCGTTFVFIGGPHEDDCETKTSAIDPHIDVSFAGDGESALYLVVREILLQDIIEISQLAQVLHHFDCSSNPVYGYCKVTIDHETFEIVNPKNRIKFTDLPLMPRELLSEFERYHYPIFQHRDSTIKATTQVMTQRGCIAKCNFCSESQRLFSRGIESLKCELKYLAENGYEAIFFDDSTFTNFSRSRKELLRELCDELAYYGFEWGCQTRVDMIDLEMCKEMASAGCTYVYFGVESFRTDLLAALGKHYDVDVIHRALRNCREVGIRVGASLLFGAPDENHVTMETVQTAQSTLNSLKRYVDDGTVVLASLNFYGYYPGTLSTISRDEVSASKLSPDDWSVSRMGEQFPYSLLEEFPAICPNGLMEIGAEILNRADKSIGDVLIGRDRYTVAGKLPVEVRQPGKNDLLLATGDSSCV